MLQELGERHDFQREGARMCRNVYRLRRGRKMSWNVATCEFIVRECFALKMREGLRKLRWFYYI